MDRRRWLLSNPAFDGAVRGTGLKSICSRRIDRVFRQSRVILIRVSFGLVVAYLFTVTLLCCTCEQIVLRRSRLRGAAGPLALASVGAVSQALRKKPEPSKCCVAERLRSLKPVKPFTAVVTEPHLAFTCRITYCLLHRLQAARVFWRGPGGSRSVPGELRKLSRAIMRAMNRPRASASPGRRTCDPGLGRRSRHSGFMATVS